ncbi:NB-ARC domain-containing protein [Planktothrix sp. FACHB-1365]|uniref:NB-ARC domain-containing protein n=1 Tax=Planktothrix sp. FACHB-1365 TaxID=2692855 RepID=UPI001683AC23|nr:NB-ARC domain-containing protein [Planktothrix sp. FACHB-1365]MBD2485379.1 ATPase [Planktothrix sp. FACHB-1365]
MDIQEVLQWTDEQVFAKTGKHLDSLQKAILEGTWQHQKYGEIAENYNCSYDHVKKQAWKLWKLLSDILEEDIKQSNFRSLFEGLSFYNNITNSCGNIVNNNVNLGGENLQISEIAQAQNPDLKKDKPHYYNNNNSNINQLKKYSDLTEAPEVLSFYDRTSELSTLKQWILEEQMRLITIYGLSEIGKSAIAVQLIKEIQQEFDIIIWRSLSQKPLLLELKTNLIQCLSQTEDSPLPTVLDYFRSYRCLIILDDLQSIFSSGQLAGQYLPNYEDYGLFFKQIATSCYPSCLILLSWEKPREIDILEGKNSCIRTLHLQGLGEEGKAILKEKELLDEEQWLELINLYQGHPIALKLIAHTIDNLFNGYVSKFLNSKTVFLGDLEFLFQSHWQRLSVVEKQIIIKMANQSEGIEIEPIILELKLSLDEIINGIQSLQRRGLVEKEKEANHSKFFLDPLFKIYMSKK